MCLLHVKKDVSSSHEPGINGGRYSELSGMPFLLALERSENGITVYIGGGLSSISSCSSANTLS